jgi:hypothetical protein
LWKAFSKLIAHKANITLNGGFGMDRKGIAVENVPKNNKNL